MKVTRKPKISKPSKSKPRATRRRKNVTIALKPAREQPKRKQVKQRKTPGPRTPQKWQVTRAYDERKKLGAGASKRAPRGIKALYKNSKAYQQARRDLVKRGKLPAGDSSKKVGKIRVTLFRYRGIHIDQELVDHLSLYRRYKQQPQIQISVGQSYGKDARFVGSPFTDPQGAIEYIRFWRQRKSSEAVLGKGARGTHYKREKSELWYEIEIIEPQQGARYQYTHIKAASTKRKPAKRKTKRNRN